MSSASPAPGGWIDQFDAAGTPLVSTMPASSLYHILGAAVEAEATEDGRMPA